MTVTHSEAPLSAGLTADFYGYENLLPEDERTLLLQARDFLRTEVQPLVNDAWAKGEFPRELIDGFRGLGLAGVPYEGYGDPLPAGSNLLVGMLSMEYTRTDASSATFFGVHNGLAMYSIYRGGDQEQRDRWLPAMAALDKIGAFAMTEPLGGSDVAGGMRTTARRAGDHWILNGAKRWIGNGTFADLVIVWARDEADDKVKGFVVEGAPRLLGRQDREQDRLPYRRERRPHPDRGPGPGGQPAPAGRLLPRCRGDPARHPQRRRLAGPRRHDRRL